MGLCLNEELKQEGNDLRKYLAVNIIKTLDNQKHKRKPETHPEVNCENNKNK